ncbi:geranylgeranyl pyrophosphate synthase-like [Schistocerca gregaria]|uniref:geranylgeranyl pyrophosphate synthase-like n=1 Tax=Schistocerca gregaria TaxID=7010 RepID=UPI00211E9698|nr:geranylgeranyl pyrophosphate synthase-like [Schistocerca gregaria]
MSINANGGDALATNPACQLTREATCFDEILKVLRPKIEEGISNRLPRFFTEDSLKRLFGNSRYAYDTESATKVLLDPIWDMLDRGGKRWRPALLMLVADAVRSVESDARLDSTLLSCAYLCELVHNGSLITDDIEDDSRLRRGKPCLHLTYGQDVAINTGNAMYFLPLHVLREMKENGHPDSVIISAYQMYGEELTKLHLGQSLDIWWHLGKKLPSVNEYLQMCAYKTGTLARLSARLAALVCGGTPEQIDAFGYFAESVGIAFQIQDDVLNLVGDEFAQKNRHSRRGHLRRQTIPHGHSLPGTRLAGKI